MASLDAVIAERLDVVEHELVAAAGGSSLCALSKSGGHVDSAKYLEGRMAALMELRRMLRQRADVGLAVTEMSTEWSAQLASVQALDAGRGWIAYRAGGVDELSEIVGLL